MITMNKATFAEGDEPTGDHFGRAVREHRMVVFFDRAGVIVAVVTKDGVLGRADPQLDGKIWYSYGDPRGIGVWPRFGLMIDAIENLAISRDRQGLIFA